MTILRLNSTFLVKGQGEKSKKVHHPEIELVVMFVVQMTLKKNKNIAFNVV